jgi:hypothetical protein
VTPATFEAEFVAWNQFREACDVRMVTREEFARAVASHNALLAAGPLDGDASEA